MISMMISGALAGMMAINNVMGEAERLVLNSVEGAGFIGIAVALMGRTIRSASSSPRSCSGFCTKAAQSWPFGHRSRVS